MAKQDRHPRCGNTQTVSKGYRELASGEKAKIGFCKTCRRKFTIKAEKTWKKIVSFLNVHGILGIY
jgi:hypothetical protein